MKPKKNQRSAEEISQAVQSVKMHSDDVGSSSVQIANLTARILHITQHMSTNRNDKHSRRGLVQLVSNRRKLLKYLKRTNADGHAQILSVLGLRK